MSGDARTVSRKTRLTYRCRLHSVSLSTHEGLPLDLLEPQSVRGGHVAEYLSQQLEWELLSDVRHRAKIQILDVSSNQPDMGR